MKEEPESLLDYHAESDSSELCKLKVEPKDPQQLSSIKVLDVTSISLQEMELLHQDNNNILRNPLATLKRNNVMKFEVPTQSSEPPRPSNAVATVLDEKEAEAQQGYVANPQIFKELLGDNSEEDQKPVLLKPTKVEDVSFYLKRKRGRPRKIREVLEIYPLADKMSVNGLVKRKRGRPRKTVAVNEERPKSPSIRSFQLAKKPDPRYFREEILMTRLRNKRL